MPLKEPSWWYANHEDWRARMLEPIANYYGDTAIRRFERRAPYHASLPVICVGNLTAGGAGKTPLALALFERLVQRGEKPAFLTRGYGGQNRGPVWVEPEVHTAQDVGDEPLLLAETGPTMVSRDRRAGAIAIEERPDITTIIMDDGLQNPGLRKDLTIAVVDGMRGLGNRLVIPAGPLRAPLEFQLEKADAIVVNNTQVTTGEPSKVQPEPVSRLSDEFKQSFTGPVISAGLQAIGPVDWLSQKPLVAFAGIGHTQRFFDTLTALGGRLAVEMSFADHHVFTETEAETLLTLRARHDAVLVTTEKDMARLSNLAERAPGVHRLFERARTLGIRLAFDTPNHLRLSALIDDALKSGGYRSGQLRRSKPQ